MSYLFIHLLHHNDKTEEVLKTGYSGMKGQCRTKWQKKGYCQLYPLYCTPLYCTYMQSFNFRSIALPEISIDEKKALESNNHPPIQLA